MREKERQTGVVVVVFGGHGGGVGGVAAAAVFVHRKLEIDRRGGSKIVDVRRWWSPEWVTSLSVWSTA